MGHIRTLVASWIAVLLLLACRPVPKDEGNHMSDPSAPNLATELQQLGFEKLFRLSDGQEMNRLWDEPGNPDRLVKLALDPTQPWLPRFLAAEVVMHKQMFALLQAKSPGALAAVYVQALRGNASGVMSDWGFLVDMQDTGELGARIALFGADATDALKPLLDDTTEVPYVTPPLQPFEARTGYRIRDFAALHLAKLRQVPLQLTADAGQRDTEIARLKSLLP